MSAATPEQKHWFWVANSRVAHRFSASWMDGSGNHDKALCGAGPAVWPAYCGCPEHPEDRPHCRRCARLVHAVSTPSERDTHSAEDKGLAGLQMIEVATA